MERCRDSGRLHYPPKGKKNRRQREPPSGFFYLRCGLTTDSLTYYLVQDDPRGLGVDPGSEEERPHSHPPPDTPKSR